MTCSTVFFFFYQIFLVIRFPDNHYIFFFFFLNLNAFEMKGYFFIEIPLSFSVIYGNIFLSYLKLMIIKLR